MAKFSLSTTVQTILKPAGFDRQVDISLGMVDLTIYVNVSMNQHDEPDYILSYASAMAGGLFVPAGVTVRAWTNTGTAVLAITKRDGMAQKVTISDDDICRIVKAFDLRGLIKCFLGRIAEKGIMRFRK